MDCIVHGVAKSLTQPSDSHFHFISNIIWYLSFCDLIHLIWHSLGPFVLLQMALFHSLLGLSNIPLYKYTTWPLSPHTVSLDQQKGLWDQSSNSVFIHSSVDGHWGHFHVLAIVNSATMSTGVHVSLWIRVFSGYMPKSRIARSHSRSIFTFLRNLRTVLHDCTHLPH